MPLKVQLMEDMKQAMRDKDSDTLSTVRFLLSEIKNVEIDNGVQDDDGIIKIITRQVKQIKDAQTDFEKAGRTDLVENEEKKIAVLKRYLPEQMSEDELKQVIATVIASIDAPNMGSVMKAVKEQVGNKADGGMLAQLVKQALQ